MKILIVDDNSDDRKILRYTIERHGHTVIEAEDGRDGLEKAAIHKHDLIISNIMMPGMDGFQFLRTIQKNEDLKYIPIVLYSAIYKGYQAKGLAISLGADAFVEKPQEPEEFWDMLKPIIEVIGSKKAASGKNCMSGFISNTRTLSFWKNSVRLRVASVMSIFTTGRKFARGVQNKGFLEVKPSDGNGIPGHPYRKWRIAPFPCRYRKFGLPIVEY